MFVGKFKMRDVTNICWQIVKWGVLLLFLDEIKFS